MYSAKEKAGDAEGDMKLGGGGELTRSGDGGSSGLDVEESQSLAAGEEVVDRPFEGVLARFVLVYGYRYILIPLALSVVAVPSGHTPRTLQCSSPQCCRHQCCFFTEPPLLHTAPYLLPNIQCTTEIISRRAC